MSFDMNNNMAYEEKASGFLKKAIAGLILSGIIMFSLGTNHRAIVDYVAAGGLHTPKIKTCAALSKGSLFAGIAMTVIYTLYFLYFILLLLAIGFSSLPNQK